MEVRPVKGVHPYARCCSPGCTSTADYVGHIDGRGHNYSRFYCGFHSRHCIEVGPVFDLANPYPTEEERRYDTA